MIKIYAVYYTGLAWYNNGDLTGAKGHTMFYMRVPSEYYIAGYPSEYVPYKRNDVILGRIEKTMIFPDMPLAIFLEDYLQKITNSKAYLFYKSYIDEHKNTIHPTVTFYSQYHQV